MATIQSIVVSLEANSAKLVDGIKKSKSAVVNFVNEIKKRTEPLRNAFSGIISGIQTIAKVAAGSVAGVAAFFGAMRFQAGFARDIINTSNLLGISTQALQEFGYAAGTVGVEQAKLSDILRDVNDKLGDFIQTGGGGAADMFEQLNIQAKDFVGLSPDQALQRLADATKNLSQQDKIFFFEALASDASLLLPLLENNGAQLRSLGEEAVRLGLVLSDSQLTGLNEFASGFDRIVTRIKGFFGQLAGYMAPAMSVVLEHINMWIDSFGDVRTAAKSAAEWIVNGLKTVIQGIANAVRGVGSIEQAFVKLQIRILEAERSWHNFWQSLKPSSFAEEFLGMEFAPDTSEGAIAIRNIDRDLSSLYEKMANPPSVGFDEKGVSDYLDDLLEDMTAAMDEADTADREGNKLLNNNNLKIDENNQRLTSLSQLLQRQAEDSASEKPKNDQTSGTGLVNFDGYMRSLKRAQYQGDEKGVQYFTGRLESIIKSVGSGRWGSDNTWDADAMQDRLNQALSRQVGTQGAVSETVNRVIENNNQALSEVSQAISQRPAPIGEINFNLTMDGKSMSTKLQGTTEHLRFLKKFIEQNTNNTATSVA